MLPLEFVIAGAGLFPHPSSRNIQENNSFIGYILNDMSLLSLEVDNAARCTCQQQNAGTFTRAQLDNENPTVHMMTTALQSKVFIPEFVCTSTIIFV